MSFLDRFVATTLPFVPKYVVGKFAAKYIAGETLNDAVAVVRSLNAEGFRATIDVLGEFVDNQREAEQNADNYLTLLEAIYRERLDSGVSVKLTAVGLSMDREFTKRNFGRVVKAATEQDIFVRIDMEDSPYTTDTLWVYRELRAQHRLGIVVQAYLRRTEADVRDLISSGEANFRLCKGIYRESESIAFQGRAEIRENYLKLLRIMLESRCYVGIATHDEFLVDGAERMILELSIDPSMYEFQMLLGVRHDLRDQIKSRGHKVRIYVPFGEAWYGYSTRRLKENPQIAGYVFKSLFRKL